jgi:hypothetical protein
MELLQRITAAPIQQLLNQPLTAALMVTFTRWLLQLALVEQQVYVELDDC